MFTHVFIYNSHSLIMGQPIKTTDSGKAGSNYLDIGTGGIGSDIDTEGTIVHI